MAGTFISYRREDAAGYAGRLRESLERRLGAARVFRDVDTLRPGQDFVQAIESRLSECAVMLAVIGRDWVNARDLAGSRRLDEPFDFVRLEIAAALARPNVLVVPVLVEGAAMPSAAELPENLKPLIRRHAVSIRDETWDGDVDRLVNVIESAISMRDPSRADAPISGARLWVAGALAVVIVGLLIFNGNRSRTGGDNAGARDGSATGGGAVSGGAASGAETPSSSDSAAGAIPISKAGGMPYTIDIPRVNEVAFADVIYAVASGNIVMRGDTPELRLRMRAINSGRYDVGFWDDSFRLAVGGDVLSPTSGLSTTVPGNSLRYGIITFRLRPQTTKATLRIVNNQATAEIPLDVSPTGRPPVDEQAEIADSLAQAVTAAVVRDPMPLLDSNNVEVTLARASTRRFTNTLRLNLSLRFNNRGRYASHSSLVVLRAEAGGETRAPWQAPNENLDPMATALGSATFDLPPNATRVVLRTTFMEQTSEKTFDLK